MPHSTIEATFQEHVQMFVEQPHTALGGQPVCPFARRARLRNRIETVVASFNLNDVATLTEAVIQFMNHDKDVLLVIHPEVGGVSFAELCELRDRFVEQYQGQYDVFTGHPDDTHTLGTLQTRREPFPVLHFIRCETLAEAEHKLGAKRLALRG